MLHHVSKWFTSVRADRRECDRPLPGDELIPAPLATLTHALTINRPPRDLWPWIAQMGAGSRAGWYSYDWIDNGGRPSARRIVRELQTLSIGMTFPALPGATDGFKLLAFTPATSLVLGWPSAAGPPMVTWAFVLESPDRRTTRLIVRVRGRADYQFRGLPSWLSRHVVRFVHFVMQRRELLGIAERAESMAESKACVSTHGEAA